MHWTGSRILPDPGVSNSWDISFGAGRFVGTSSVGGFATSTDGERWEKIDGVSTNQPLMITYGNDKFLAALGSSGSSTITALAESADGIHWTTRPAPAFYINADCQTADCPQMTTAFGLTFSAGKFSMVAYSSSRTALLTSPDGIVWTPGETFSFSGHGRSTPNGIHEVNGTVQQDHIDFENGVYVTVGSQLLRGPSLTDLAPVPRGYDPMVLYSVAAHGDTIIAAGHAQHLDPSSQIYNQLPLFLTSTNGGRTFEARTNLTTSFVHKLIFANGKFLGVGENGLIAESTSGLDWNEIASPVNWTLGDIAFGNGRWVIAGGGNGAGGVLYSEDGTHFAKASGTNVVYNVAFGAGRFAGSGSNNSFFSSTNGIDWDPGQSPATGFGSAIAYGNGRFISGSNISFDGTTWQSATRMNYAIGFLGGKFYSIDPATSQSFVSTVYSSVDGITWESSSIPARLQGIDVSDGTLWLFNSQNFTQNGSSPSLWRLLAPSIHLRSEGTAVGNIRVQFDVPEPGRYRVQRSATIDGAWQPGNLLDIGFRSGWEESSSSSPTEFFKVVKE